MFKNSDATCLDIEPLNPITEGHRIVIPREHLRDFMDNSAETASLMEYAAERGEELMREKGYAGMNLITSAGVAATQSVFHLHVHLVPRSMGDGLKLPWTGQKKP